VTRVVQQNVFRLQVSIDDVELVQMVQGAKQLGRVEPRAIFGEPAFALQVVEELATVDEG
jgi:hypothetical protein